MNNLMKQTQSQHNSSILSAVNGVAAILFKSATSIHACKQYAASLLICLTAGSTTVTLAAESSRGQLMLRNIGDTELRISQPTPSIGTKPSLADQLVAAGSAEFSCDQTSTLFTGNTTAQLVGCNNTATSQNYPTPANFSKEGIMVANTSRNGGCNVILTITQSNGKRTPIKIPANQGKASIFINKKVAINKVTNLKIECDGMGSSCSVKYKIVVK